MEAVVKAAAEVEVTTAVAVVDRVLGGGGGGGGGSNYILSGATSVTHTRGGGATYNAHGSLSITYTASSTEYGDIVINGDLKLELVLLVILIEINCKH